MTTPDIDAISKEARDQIWNSSDGVTRAEEIIVVAILRAVGSLKEDFETSKALERGAAMEAIRQRDEAIEVLKSVEWVIKTSYGSTCPVCLWWNETGHKPDCKLAKAIGK